MEKNEKKEIALSSIEKTIDELETYVINELPKARYRFKKFVEVFNKEFSLGVDSYKYGAAQALTWALMGNSIILYAIGMNESAIIELHSYLERLAAREVLHSIEMPKKSSTLTRSIERHNLKNSVSILRDFGILDDDDWKFAEKLTTLRNAIVHKNPQKISRLIKSEETISWLDMTKAMSKIDVISLIINSLNLMYKISQIEEKIGENLILPKME